MVMHTTANNQRETQVVAQSSQPGAEQSSSQEASSFEVSFLSRCGLPIIPVRFFRIMEVRSLLTRFLAV